MTTEKAIQLLTDSELPEGERDRLINLLNTEGWTPGVQQQVLTAIKQTMQSTKSELDSADATVKQLDEGEANELAELEKSAQADMDQAEAEYNQEMVGINKEVDDLAEEAKQIAE